VTVLDRHMAEAVRQIREEYGDGPEVPDEMIAGTYAAHVMALEIAIADLPWWTFPRRLRRRLERSKRIQRQRLEEAVARLFVDPR
jgi:hypothetical protein